MGKIVHEELSRSIIGAAMDVLNELKPGLDEKLHERAMTIELKRCGHLVAVQTSFPVHFRGELIGNLVPDLIIDDLVIVDPKVVLTFNETHHCPNDRLPKHHRPSARAAPKLQERQPQLETRRKPIDS